MADKKEPTRRVVWDATDSVYDYQSGRITVTITLAEYRDLVGKAALYDEQQRVYDEMAGYGESEE